MLHNSLICKGNRKIPIITRAPTNYIRPGIKLRRNHGKNRIKYLRSHHWLNSLLLPLLLPLGHHKGGQLSIRIKHRNYSAKKRLTIPHLITNIINHRILGLTNTLPNIRASYLPLHPRNKIITTLILAMKNTSPKGFPLCYQTLTQFTQKS